MGADHARRSVRVAVTGAAGTGKTTLATALAARLRLPLVEEQMGGEVLARGPLEARPPDAVAAALRALWDARQASYARLDGFVADGCALDLAAYALHHGAAAPPGAGTPPLVAGLAAAAARYDVVLVLPHGAIPDQRGGVRPEDPTARLRYQLLLEALLARHAVRERVHLLPGGCLALEARLAWALARVAATAHGALPAPAPAPARGERAPLPAPAGATARAAPPALLDAHHADPASGATGGPEATPAPPAPEVPRGADLATRHAGCRPGAEAPRRGFVHLVGAGPGDPGLLTVRALELLRGADVVAYDELVPPALLACAGPRAERVAVGRRHHGSSRHPLRIHPAVVERARAGQVVVRLKAGDPFVFGRGGEEAEELAAEGIPFDVVPGVSAALGAAASALIPLTHRDHASDVTFATGHDLLGCKGTGSDWAKLAGSGTLVLYMASRALAANLDRLVAMGRPPATPAAWIANATRPDQRVVIGTVADLAGRVPPDAADAPALVVVGEVVAVRERVLAARAAFQERAHGGTTRTPRAHAAASEAAPPTSKAPTGGSAGGRDPTSPQASLAGHRGLLVVYTGDGKGKTTAALGMVLRALGRGIPAAVVQFIKGRWKTGERLFGEGRPGLDFLTLGQGFTWDGADPGLHARAAQGAWARARELLAVGEHAVVVLDELTHVVNHGYVPLAEVLAVLAARPPHVTAVVTGRAAAPALVETADLVTEMRAVKHPFARGVPALPGVDF